MKRIISCHCNDGCMPPVLAEEDGPNRWRLMGLSKVMGMGVGEWARPLLESSCDEVVAFNRMDGKNSYVAFRQKSDWSLLEIKDNGTLECAVNLLGTDGKFEDLDLLLKNQGISRTDFMIDHVDP